MVLALVVALLGGQVIYEWVDAKGQSHFTNDASTIPSGVSRRETRGGEFSVVPASPPAPAKKVEALVETSVDTCAEARVQISGLEQQLEEARVSADQWAEEQGRRCQQVLLVLGHPFFASCMAGRSEPPPPDEAVTKQLEDAREQLRRAQVSGCR